mmetsp:Transcript_26728/g.39693  ORF Transcript_26728/g.39693 Transcript_26728/m.39693 type:complete len:117 (+) Transcript_26728:21-371(+)
MKLNTYIFKLSKTPLIRTYQRSLCTVRKDINILHIYRHILRYAAVYPSIKRDKVIKQIKIEFRENRNLKESEELEHAKEKAILGISHLRKYCDLDMKSNDWVVDLEKDPMPSTRRK